MARSRSETIGGLGRTPAKTSGGIPRPPAPPPTPERPEPERGAFGRWVHDALFTNVGLKFVSLVLAVTVFLLVNTDTEAEVSATVGVRYTLPDDKVLVSPRLEEVHVTIRGPKRKLDQFDKSEIERVDLDLRNENGGEIPIAYDKIHLPKGLTVASVSPKFVRVVFEKRGEKVVEITPKLSGHPQHGYVVAEVKTEPTTAKVRGAESTLRGLAAIRTRELSLDGRTESFALDTELVPPDGVELEGATVVNLQVHLDESLETRKLPGLVVTLRPAADGLDLTKWKLVPPTVDVTLTGATLAVDKARDALTPYAKITAAELGAAAQKDGKAVDVQIDGLPPGIGVKLSPERVRLVQNPR